ncbi:unnamed protein product, partial [marine sediment metagenome]
MKNKGLFLSIILILAIFACNIAFAEVNQWTWMTSKGTFVLSERIAKKVANGEKLIFKTSTFFSSAPLFVPVKQGFKDASEKLGVDMKMVGPTDGVVEKQVSELE